MKPNLLFVDDEPRILDSLRRILRQKSALWEMRFANGADAALEALQEAAFDVVITDMRMPGKNGFDLLEAIRAGERTQDIPVIFLTGENDQDLKRKALDLGAYDLLNKPVCTEELIARISSVLRLKSYQDEIKAQNILLEEKVSQRTQALLVSRQEILWRLAKAGEYRDELTGNHVLRVARYCAAIGESLGLDPVFVERLTLASPLHDIGKIGIPDSILHKPGKLTPDEWEIMKRHCIIGAGILQEDYTMPNVLVLPGTRPENPLLDMAASIALNHHEKWDGSGYPHGLTGEAIPMEARIVALADVYDALSSARPYKPAFSESEVMTCMTEGIGRHFDPSAYAGFKNSIETIRAIRAEYSDTEAANGRRQPDENNFVCG